MIIKGKIELYTKSNDLEQHNKITFSSTKGIVKQLQINSIYYKLWVHYLETSEEREKPNETKSARSSQHGYEQQTQSQSMVNIAHYW